MPFPNPAPLQRNLVLLHTSDGWKVNNIFFEVLYP